MEFGKKHGFGEEYFQENLSLKYKGYYKEDLYNGSDCKLWDKNSNQVYEGDFEQGKKSSGYGKEYYLWNNQVKYIGFYQNDLHHGKNCKIYRSNGALSYIGDMVNGLKEGTGKEYYENNAQRYEGTFVKDKWDGAECCYYDKYCGLIFKGEFKEGRMMTGIKYEFYGKNNLRSEVRLEGENITGKCCKYYYPNGNVQFEGQLVKNIKEGFGIEYFDTNNDNRIKYEGLFKNDLYHGKGQNKLYHMLYGLCFCGEFYEGQPLNGKEIEYYNQNNVKKEVWLKNGVIHGEWNKFWFANGYLEWEGRMVDGKRNGRGKEYYKRGKHLKYCGGYYEDTQYGEFVKCYDSNGKLKYHGTFVEGKPYGFGRGFYANGQIRYIGPAHDGDIIKTHNYIGVKRPEFDVYYPQF